MFNRNSRIDLLRKRSAAHKVSVSELARENQIILVNLNLAQLAGSQLLPSTTELNSPERLAHLNKLLFKLCEQHNILNASFIYNNKLPRVMFGEEAQFLETQQQLIFIYNPKQIFGYKSIIDEQQVHHKIQLLFLPQGDRLRYNAARFHQQVNRLICEFAQQLNIAVNEFEFEDQQHLTFDLFAKNKGAKQTIIHGFRPLKLRYLQQSLIVPESAQSMTFAVVTLPIKRNIIALCDIDEQAPDPYNPLYTFINDLFVHIAKQYNLNHQVMIADAKVPIVCNDNESYVIPKGELVFLGCNNQGTGGSYVSQWDNKRLVDVMTIVFIANENNYNKRGYGRFVNHICEVMKLLAGQLNIDGSHEAITLRFHQHLNYKMPKINR